PSAGSHCRGACRFAVPVRRLITRWGRRAQAVPHASRRSSPAGDARAPAADHGGGPEPRAQSACVRVSDEPGTARLPARRHGATGAAVRAQDPGPRGVRPRRVRDPPGRPARRRTRARRRADESHRRDRGALRAEAGGGRPPAKILEGSPGRASLPRLVKSFADQDDGSHAPRRQDERRRHDHRRVRPRPGAFRRHCRDVGQSRHRLPEGVPLPATHRCVQGNRPAVPVTKNQNRPPVVFHCIFIISAFFCCFL
ncbi:MAG: hypothetical protein BJ554DRAFT_3587, partial [Olpidium bornovanus]